MAVDQRRLVDAAMELRGAAPAQWEAFVTAAREYAGAMTLEILRVSPDHLHKAQGMALGAHEFTAILADAPKLKDKFMEAALKHARVVSDVPNR